MATLEERVAKLEAGATTAGWDGYGPAPATPAGTPGEGVSPNGSVLPWNAQAGEAGRLVFQGHAEFVINPESTKAKTLVLSVVAPSFKAVEVRLRAPNGDQMMFWGASAGYFQETLPNLVPGNTYTLVIDATNPTNGSGLAQLIGG